LPSQYPFTGLLVNTISLSNVAPLFLFPPFLDPTNETDILLHLGHSGSLPEEGAGGANVYAFPTFGAGNALSPFLVHVDDYPVIDTAPLHVECMGAFDLIAGPDTAGTAYAPVVVQSVSLVGKVYCGEVRAAIFETRVVHSKFSASCTQLAAAVCHANGTDMVPFGKQELKKHLSVLLELFCMGLDHHSILGLGRARGHEPSGTLHLYEAEPASANGG
jgi:hypothetical protein